MNQVAVTNLSPHLATRAAGLIAFNTLMTLDFTSITIDLNDALGLSYIFLDEFIYRAIEVGIISQISFSSDDTAAMGKLAYIAKTRDVEIVVSSATSEKHPIEPQGFSKIARFLVEDKDKLPITEVTPIKTETTKSIYIRQLTSKLVTRNRAVEALANLQKQEFDLIAIGLDNELKLTYTFLDEMVLNASKTSLLGRSTFHTDDAAVLDKLAYISGVRNLDIAVSGTSRQKYQVLLKTFSRHKANLVENKDNLTQN